MRNKLSASVLCAGLVMAAALYSPARAQDAETLEAARQLQDVTKAAGDNALADISKAVWENMNRTLPEKVDSETRTELKGAIDRIMAKYNKDMQTEAPSIYAKYYSAEELRGLKAFYETPLGRKSLTATPKVMSEVMQGFMSRQMAPLMQEIQSTFQEILTRRGVEL